MPRTLQIEGREVSARLVRWLGYRTGSTFVSRGSKISSPCQIGEGTRINGALIAKGKGNLIVGKHCAIGSDLRVITQNHDVEGFVVSMDLYRRVHGKPASVKIADVEIGNNVWIGDLVILLPGVRIGDGAVIGAGSVVTRDIQPFMIAAGNPAREIRSRWREGFQVAVGAEFWDQDSAEIEKSIRDFGL